MVVVPLQGDGVDLGVEGSIIVFEDVTSRARLEEQLQISDKMASIGLLAAGVAHEVNTPLTGISSYTQMLLDRADPEDPQTKLLEKIERQTFRAAKIVNGLLTLARGGQAANERAPVDLNTVINDVLSLLEHQFRAVNIQVRRDLAPAPPMVFGMEHKLQQVFLNLFINARDAMPKGGWLSVTTRADGEWAMVEVGDTGAGHPDRAPLAHLRPVLHHQGPRPGHGARPLDHLRHCRRARRSHQLRQPPRRGHTVHAGPAAHARRPAGGRRRRAGARIGPWRAPAPSSSSTTKRSCGRSSRRS